MWRIFRCLFHATRSLTLAELEKALLLLTGISKWYRFAEDVEYPCGSLPSFDGPQEEIEFDHQTAGTFIEPCIQSQS